MSIHAGERPRFQSTLPVWGATAKTRQIQHPLLVSIHAPRVGSDETRVVGIKVDCVSIHAPRVGATFGAWQPEERYSVSIHAPRVGSDASTRLSASAQIRFNPRSPCGERRWIARGDPAAYRVSIHAPRVGSDLIELRPISRRSRFQSTLPVWGATRQKGASPFRGGFNPRSPCGERRWHDTEDQGLG